jgi:di/tricarboxylate transporter
MVTIIGTSTTLVVTGLVTQAGLKNIGFFDIAMVALPSGIMSVLVMTWLAPIILPRTDGLFRMVRSHAIFPAKIRL